MEIFILFILTVLMMNCMFFLCNSNVARNGNMLNPMLKIQMFKAVFLKDTSKACAHDIWVYYMKAWVSSQECYFDKLYLNFVRSHCNRARMWTNPRWLNGNVPCSHHSLLVGHEVHKTTNWHNWGIVCDSSLRGLPWSNFLKHAWFL